MPIVGPLIAGGTALAGGIINSAVSMASANKQMRFQERMSSTAHQREVEDLRKAGLNPLLSLKSGGASSPPGAKADVDIGADKAVNSALQARSIESNIELQKAQANQANSAAAYSQAQTKQVTEMLPGQVQKVNAEVQSVLAGTEVSKSQVNEIAKRIEKASAEIKLINQQADTESARALKEKALKVLWEGVRDILKKGDKQIRSIEDFPGLLQLIKKWTIDEPARFFIGPSNSAKDLKEVIK